MMFAIALILTFALHTTASVLVYKNAHQVLSVCIENGTDNKPFYVRGTIDNFSYGEGKVIDITMGVDGEILSIQALLSNVGVVLGGKDITTVSASSFLTLNETTGTLFYWPSGNGATLNASSFLEGVEFSLCNDSPHTCLGVSASVNLEKRFCLWQPGSKAALPASKSLSPSLYTEFSSTASKGTPAFPSAFYSSGIGPKSTHGNVLGVYGYKYEGESNPCYVDGKWTKGCTNVETGYYGADAITFIGASSSILISSWNAQTGPYKGSKGTVLYSFSDKTMVGIFCNLDKVDGVQTLVDCSFEEYYLYPQTTAKEWKTVHEWVKPMSQYFSSAVLKPISTLLDFIKASAKKK